MIMVLYHWTAQPSVLDEYVPDFSLLLLCYISCFGLLIRSVVFRTYFLREWYADEIYCLFKNISCIPRNKKTNLKHDSSTARHFFNKEMLYLVLYLLFSSLTLSIYSNHTSCWGALQFTASFSVDKRRILQRTFYPLVQHYIQCIQCKFSKHALLWSSRAFDFQRHLGFLRKINVIAKHEN